jgi:virulence-associated protein VagC
VAHPVPFEEARQATLEAKKRAPVARQASSPTTPAEIVQLARALKNDPDLIYQYVHDNIQFSPLWGYLKGPVGTLLDGQGDAFDQCSLMVALLNQAALSNSSISNAGYEIGELMRLPAEFRFEGTEVFIRRDPATGDVILSPRPESWKPFFDLADKGDVSDDFLSDRRDAPPLKRDLF